MGLDLGEVVGELGANVDVAQPMPHDDEGLLDPGANVDTLNGRLVEIGVALDRGDDVPDAGERHLQLPEQLTDRCVGRQPRDGIGRHLGQGLGGPADLDQRAGGLVARGEGPERGDAIRSIQRRSRRRRSLRRPRRRARPREGLGGVTALSSDATERIAAAAGLFSSWARPAASVPSPASFSRSRSVDSIVRSRATAVRMTARATSGPASSSSRIVSTGMRSASASVRARTDARRRPPSSAAISPWSDPGPTRASGISLVPVRFVTSSSPSRTT